MGNEVRTGSLMLSTYPKCKALSLTMKQSGPCRHDDSLFKLFENWKQNQKENKNENQIMQINPSHDP
jgi:hypothetical protein